MEIKLYQALILLVAILWAAAVIFFKFPHNLIANMAGHFYISWLSIATTPLAASIIHIISSNFMSDARFDTKKEEDKEREKETKKNEEDAIKAASVVTSSERMRYYKFFRDEIRREDEITHQRLTWGLTFQGFAISAMAILLNAKEESGGWLSLLRLLALCAVGVIGLAMAVSTYVGVWASRESIKNCVQKWNNRNKVWNLYPGLLPQPVGQIHAFFAGQEYAVNIPRIFIFSWGAYLTLLWFIMINIVLESRSNPTVINDLASLLSALHSAAQAFMQHGP